MMALRTDALVAVAAVDIMKEHAARYLPWRVLRIGEGIEIDDGCSDRGREMGGTSVVADDKCAGVDQGCQLAKRQGIGQIDRAGDRTRHHGRQFPFAVTTGDKEG